jgi:plastocyanin
MGTRLVVVSALVAVGTLVFVALAAGRPEATSVAVTAGEPAELRFTLSKRTATKGPATFTVTNRGTLVHDFKIAGKKTPIIGPGKRAVLKVTLRRAGKYPFLCTVAGHAAGGMKGVLTVR